MTESEFERGTDIFDTCPDCGVLMAEVSEPLTEHEPDADPAERLYGMKCPKCGIVEWDDE